MTTTTAPGELSEAPPMTAKARARAARMQASTLRRAHVLRAWLEAQRLDPPGPGRWLAVWSELKDAPVWDAGPLNGEEAVACVEAMAAEDYTVRRLTVAGGDVRLVEVWTR